MLAAVLGTLSVAAGISTCRAPFGVRGDHGCYDFPQIRSMQNSIYQIEDPHGAIEQAPVQYILASPCSNAVPTATVLHPPKSCLEAINGTCNCTSFKNGQLSDAPSFIYAGTVCFALGNISQQTTTLIDPTNASAGIFIDYAGGAGGSGCGTRGVRYKLVCDPSAPLDAGPSSVTPHVPEACDVEMTWQTPAACVAAPVDPSTPGCALPPPPPPLDDRPHLVSGLQAS